MARSLTVALLTACQACGAADGAPPASPSALSDGEARSTGPAASSSSLALPQGSAASEAAGSEAAGSEAGGSDPDEPVADTYEARLLAGRRALAAGRPERARAHLVRAVELRANPFASCELAWADLLLGDAELAERRLREAMSSSGGDGASARTELCRYRRGRALEALGRLADAALWYHRSDSDAARERLAALRSRDMGADAAEAVDHCLSFSLRQQDHYRFCRVFGDSPLQVIYEGFWDQGRDMSSLSLFAREGGALRRLGGLTPLLIEEGSLRDEGVTTSRYTAELTSEQLADGGREEVRLRLENRWTDRRECRSVRGTEIQEGLCGVVDGRWRCALVVLDPEADWSCEATCAQDACESLERAHAARSVLTLRLRAGRWELRARRGRAAAGYGPWMGVHSPSEILSSARPVRE